jgi:Calcineurin-like phosphoesterase
MRIVQISDTHLSHRGGIGYRNFEELAAFINDELRPDLVVHTGDVTMLDPDSKAEEQAQWDWLGTLAEQAGGRPALAFCHKALWPPVPPQSSAGATLSIPSSVLDRLLDTLDPVDVRVFGSGHLHRFEVGLYNDALTVRAPSTAFVTRTSDDLAGPGLRQLGVVEYRCDPGSIEVFFRSLPTLTEAGPLDCEAFRATAADMGVSV